MEIWPPDIQMLLDQTAHAVGFESAKWDGYEISFVLASGEEMVQQEFVVNSLTDQAFDAAYALLDWAHELADIKSEYDQRKAEQCRKSVD